MSCFEYARIRGPISVVVALSLVGAIALSTDTVAAAASPPSTASSTVIVTNVGSIIVTDGRRDVSNALVTWGSDGVIWAAADARTLEVEPSTGVMIEVPISTQVPVSAKGNVSGANLASLGSFTCTVYTSNPVAYLSASPKLVGGQAEQICSGTYIQQRVQARLQLNTTFGWTSGSPWTYSSWSSSSYRTSTAFVNCFAGSWKYRANGQGSVQTVSGTSSSPVVLSGGEPSYTC
jgi:hypothetical protein